MSQKTRILLSSVITILLMTLTPVQPGAAGSSFSAPDGFVLGVKGGYSSMLGFYGKEFKPGISFGLMGDYYTAMKFLFWEMEFNYGSYELKANTDSSLTDMSFLAGPLFTANISRYFQPFAGIMAGGSYMSLELAALKKDETTFKAVGAVKAGFITNPIRGVPIRLEGIYKVNQLSGELYQNYQFGLSAMVRGDIFGSGNQLGRKESLVQITKIKLNPIFGARYGNYKEGNIGMVTVENVGRNVLYNIRVDTDIAEITDKPTSTKTVKMLKPRQKAVLVVVVRRKSAANRS